MNGVVVVNCTLSGRKGQIAPAPANYKITGPTKGKPEGTLYVAVDPEGKPIGATEQTVATIREREAQAEEFKRRAKDRARKLWSDAAGSRDHPRVRAYLAHRGIDLERLPGGKLPAVLRYHPRVPEMMFKGPQRPAMLALVVDADGKGSSVHVTFLHREWRPELPATDRRCGKELIDPAKKMCGPSNGRAVRLHDGDGYRAGVLAVGEGIETMAAVLAALGGDYAVWSLLSAAFLPSWLMPDELLRPGGPVHTVLICADLDRSRTGMKEAKILANAIRAKYPHLNTVISAPSASACPSLVELIDGEDRPAAGAKGVDWDDVYRSLGVQVVRSALLSSLGSPPSPDSFSGPGTRAEPAELGAEGGAGGRRGGVSGPGGGPLWAGAPDEDLPTIEEGPVIRARRFLVERCAPREGQYRHSIVRYGAKWWIHDGRAYVELKDEDMRSVVWEWLDGFRTVKRDRLVRLNPTSKAVEEVIKALAIDTAAAGLSMPMWLPPTLDDDGRPLWGRALERHRGVMRWRPPADDARQLLVFPNGLLDTARLCDRSLPVEERTRLLPHRPDLFTATCLPFDMPSHALADLLRGRDRDDVYAELCPKFYTWMADASMGDDDWERQLRQMLGDTISADRSIEKIYGVVGKGRGGKGILEDAICALLGEENIGSLDSTSLTDRFGLAHLVGKAAAIMPDAQLEGFGQAIIVERLKSISGQGRIPIRDLYAPVSTHKLGCRIWIFMNQEPDLGDQSGALAGRFIWLPIRKGNLGREDESIKKAIPREAPGIMLMALEGLIDLCNQQRRAIAVSTSGTQIADAFVEDSAPLEAFVQDWVEYDPRYDSATQGVDSLMTVQELYHLYECYCDVDLKRHPLGLRKFIKAIKWHMQPFDYTQRRGEADQRVRRVEGWFMNPAVREDYDAWRNQQQASPPRRGGEDGMFRLPRD
ncbi:MAG: hypothetical protein AMXMBFR58_29450 [Phycisphaerae bacterium]